MKKKFKILFAIFIFLLFWGVCFLGYRWYKIKNAVILVNLVADLNIEVGEKIHVSNLIVSINGKLKEDYVLDTASLGEKKATINFMNDEGIDVKYDFFYNVVDQTAPIVWLSSNYTLAVGANENWYKNIMCADNFDANPDCEVSGEYNLNEPGVYPLTFIASDDEGNVLNHSFSLNVISNSNSSGVSVQSKTLFSDVMRNYKSNQTEIGLDLSTWQGDVDFEKIKNEGVEFVILRVGTTRGINGEYVLDNKFIQNIEKARDVNMPVGLYFYSYANSEEKAVEEANWIIEQIKDYDIELPIAFDWENWSFYNDFNLSLLGLSNMADSFIKTLENAGYEGMLYGSKSYLERVWPKHDHKVWLAHYTSKTNYQGKYEFWQICSDGVISGINGYVDINIRYK